MISLFIDTHDKNIIEALYKDGKILDKNIRLSERNHSDYTMPMLKDLLENNNLSVHDLDEILVCNGPGSFTGVRIGVTIAKTLAYTLNIPIKTITSLECLAESSKCIGSKATIIRDIKGVFCSLFDENNNLLDGPFYKSNSEFEEYIKEKDLNKDAVIENADYNFESIYTRFKNIETTRAHEVKPLYIKVIEALKDDKTS